VPEAAPFDAIILSAAAASVPEALPGQLRLGGRLVMPLGEPNEVQRLVRVTRTGDEAFELEELGQVRFVPLIAGDDAPRRSRT
jgi:protein-L-isoaspartate(D-aspartate) O-methyltransferase